MHVEKYMFIKTTYIPVFSANNCFARMCSICNCEINTLYTKDMYANVYANDRLPFSDHSYHSGLLGIQCVINLVLFCFP